MMGNDKETISLIVISFYPLIALLAFVGNTLAFFTFSRVKFKMYSYAIYFQFLTVINSFVIIKACNYFSLYRYQFSIMSLSDLSCKLFLYTVDAPDLASGKLDIFLIFHLYFNYFFMFYVFLSYKSMVKCRHLF